MKVLILKNNLVEGIAAVERAVGSMSNLPILKSVLLKASENKIVATATNLEIAAQATIPGKIVEEGEIAVPFSIFSTIVKNLNAERVSLDQAGSKLAVTTDNYEASLQGADAKDFPIIPTLPGNAHSLSLAAGTLLDALSSVIVAAQYSEIRPEISGVYFSLGNDALTLAATDSFRLAERSISKSEIKAAVDTMSFIVPLRTAEEVLRVFGGANDDLKITSDQNQILFEASSRRIISRLIDGTFPEYHAIIPKGSQTTAVVERSELIQALKLTSSFSGRANDITLAVGDNKKFIELTAADSVVGENRYRVPVKLKGEKFSIVFNWKYLLDGLKIFKGSEIAFGVNPTGPVTVTSLSEPALLYILMPIKS